MSTDRGADKHRKRSLFRRFTSWQTLMAIASPVIALSGLLLAYLALQDPEPGLTFETISDTNVLDLRRPLQDLNIVFRGDNIQEQNLNLRILTINVVNSGEVDVLPIHYDYEDVWGMKFTNGEVIEARLVDTSSDYLWSRVLPQRLDTNVVAFPKVIFERGDFFAVEVLLLHPKNESPSISSVGKIAGINEITVLTRPLGKEDVGFVAELFKGSALIQVARIIIYLLGCFLLITAVILLLINITDFFGGLNANKRRNRILRTQAIRQIDQEEARDLLVIRYETNGLDALKRLQEMINNPREIEWVTPPAKWKLSSEYHVDRWPTISRFADLEHGFITTLPTLDVLSKVGILERGQDNNAVLDSSFGETIDKLLTELDD